MKNAKLKLLWVDSAHMHIWTDVHEHLRQRGIVVTTLTLSGLEYMLKFCEGQDMLMYHPGSSTTDARLAVKMKAIKDKFPKIIIGLQTDTIHHEVVNLVNFRLALGYRSSEVYDILISQLPKD